MTYFFTDSVLHLSVNKVKAAFLWLVFLLDNNLLKKSHLYSLFIMINFGLATWVDLLFLITCHLSNLVLSVFCYLLFKEVSKSTRSAKYTYILDLNFRLVIKASILFPARMCKIMNTVFPCIVSVETSFSLSWEYQNFESFPNFLC